MFNVIATVIKEQLARIGVTANIRLVDKVSWMNTTLGDGPWDMYVEDLLSLLTIDSNGYLASAYISDKSSAWSHPRHTDTKVDDYFARYAKELDPAKRKALAKEFLEYMANNMYWNTISGSPFYMVAQPWMKGYVYNARVRGALPQGLAGQVTARARRPPPRAVVGPGPASGRCAPTS